jgi:transposase
MAEFGIIERLGVAGLNNLIARIEADEVEVVPPLAREALLLLAGQICDAQMRVSEIEKRILAWHRLNETSRRLETVPGIRSSPVRSPLL